MAISVDFRQRVVDAYKNREGGYDVIASRFSIGVCSVRRWVALYRETGALEKRPHKGRMAKIKQEQLPQLEALINEKPDRTVEEIKNIWVVKTGVEMHRSSIVRAVQRLNMTLKKRPSAPVKETRIRSSRGA
jgi:transposase